MLVAGARLAGVFAGTRTEMGPIESPAVIPGRVICVVAALGISSVSKIQSRGSGERSTEYGCDGMERECCWMQCLCPQLIATIQERVRPQCMGTIDVMHLLKGSEQANRDSKRASEPQEAGGRMPSMWTRVAHYTPSKEELTSIDMCFRHCGFQQRW